MSVKILRPLRKKNGNSKYPNIYDVQICLQRGFDVGISLDTMYTYLTERERLLVDKLIVKYEFKTQNACAIAIGVSPDRVGKGLANAYRKLRNCIINKFLMDFCRREFGLYNYDITYTNPFNNNERIISHRFTHSEIASDVFNCLLSASNDDLKKLSNITNDIYLSLK